MPRLALLSVFEDPLAPRFLVGSFSGSENWMPHFRCSLQVITHEWRYACVASKAFGGTLQS